MHVFCLSEKWNSAVMKITEGLDVWRALKNDISDICLLEERSQHKSSQTTSYNKHSRLVSLSWHWGEWERKRNEENGMRVRWGEDDEGKNERKNDDSRDGVSGVNLLLSQVLLFFVFVFNYVWSLLSMDIQHSPLLYLFVAYRLQSSPCTLG
jgi:hypothetical protein